MIGFDDPAITAAATARVWATSSTGSIATARRSRPGASVVHVGETPSTYPAWRQIAAALVRDGDLPGAAAAYREADRRAPAEDKAGDRVAARLAGQGDRRPARAAAATSPGAAARAGLPIPLTYLIIGLTVIVSLTAFDSDPDGPWTSRARSGSTRRRSRRASGGAC